MIKTAAKRERRHCAAVPKSRRDFSEEYKFTQNRIADAASSSRPTIQVRTDNV